MKIYELVIDNEADLMLGVNAISLVTAPAIEANFQFFSKEEIKPKTMQHSFQTTDEEQRIVTGAILIPEKLIYRRREDEEFYVFLSEATIRQASQLFLKRGRQAQSTIEHAERVDGVVLVESWLVVDANLDKSNAMGMPQVEGTWMGSMKIDNEEVWQDYVKTGLLKGFSIEAFFSEIYTGKQTDMSKQVNKDDDFLTQLLLLIEEIK